MDYESRLTALLQQVNGSHPLARKDLIKIYGTCRSILDRISIESVTCRRLHKETTALQDLTAELDEQLSMLEQYVTFAQLAFIAIPR